MAPQLLVQAPVLAQLSAQPRRGQQRSAEAEAAPLALVGPLPLAVQQLRPELLELLPLAVQQLRPELPELLPLVVQQLRQERLELLRRQKPVRLREPQAQQLLAAVLAQLLAPAPAAAAPPVLRWGSL